MAQSYADNDLTSYVNLNNTPTTQDDKDKFCEAKMEKKDISFKKGTIAVIVIFVIFIILILIIGIIVAVSYVTKNNTKSIPKNNNDSSNNLKTNNINHINNSVEYIPVIKSK
jgi:cytoskeletal protein RodZ